MYKEPIMGLPEDVFKDVRNQLRQAMAILKQTQSQLEDQSSDMDEALAIAGVNKLLDIAASDLDGHSFRL